MGYKSNIEIAQEARARPINGAASALGISEKYIENYRPYKAKIDCHYCNDVLKDRPDTKLVLVIATNPTPADEGKITMTIGLADALNRPDKEAMAIMREPFLGPVFGVKDGATDEGYAQVVPMEDINLHFTGDPHTVGVANSLLTAMLNNHIHQGNALHIDTRRITSRRAADMDDHQLQNTVDGLGGKPGNTIHQDRFNITMASEVMVVFCPTNDIMNLKERLARIIIAYNLDGQPVAAEQLKAQGAMVALLEGALKPNLMQSLEGTPASVHGGPFANITHGYNNATTTKMGCKLVDYMVTEAGFGADLGVEKFVDIRYHVSRLCPNAVVLVATIRALKYNGGVFRAELNSENLEALNKGIPNLLEYIENITTVYHPPAVVTIDKFPSDTAAELEPVGNKCRELRVSVALTDVWGRGGAGGGAPAEGIIRLSEGRSTMEFMYDTNLSIREKMGVVAVRVYGADEVGFAPGVLKEARNLEGLEYGNLPICMAKVQCSPTSNAKLLGRPWSFKIPTRDIIISVGARLLMALAGDTVEMPRLPKVPAAEKIDVDENGSISGLF